MQPYYEVESMDTRKNESSYMFCDLVPNTVYTVTGYIKPAVEGYWSEVKVAPEDTTPKDGKYILLSLFQTLMSQSTLLY